MPAPALMNLKVLLPFQVLIEKTGVTRIIAKTAEGSIGLLPHRLDCVAALAPGILVYEQVTGGESYLAVAGGVIIKTSLEVVISVRNAIAVKMLETLVAVPKKLEVWAVGERVHALLTEPGLQPAKFFSVPRSVQAIRA